MEVKKSSKADLESGRFVRFLIGLLAASSLLMAALQWRTEAGPVPAPKVEPYNGLPEAELLSIRLEPSVSILPAEAVSGAVPVNADQVQVVADNAGLSPASLSEALRQEWAEDMPEAVADLTGVTRTESEPADEADRLPTFPGGDAACMRFLTRNVRYPSALANRRITGRVRVQFVVEKDGRLTDFRVLDSVHPALDREALRIVRLMPAWVPGYQKGQPSRFLYVLPVEFRLR